MTMCEGNNMVSAKVVIKNPTGLHLRPAGILCKEAMNFKSSVNFRFKNTANAKSVLSVLGALRKKSGDEIEFVCEGVDEKEALAPWFRLSKTDWANKSIL